MKRTILLLLLSGINLLCFSKPSTKEEGFSLSKIIFHSSACYGSCPTIDIQIDSSRAVTVNRVIFAEHTKGGDTDITKSGMFTG